MEAGLGKEAECDHCPCFFLLQVEVDGHKAQELYPDCRVAELQTKVEDA